MKQSLKVCVMKINDLDFALFTDHNGLDYFGLLDNVKKTYGKKYELDITYCK